MTIQRTALIGIDIGGTFTDFVIFIPDSGGLSKFKLLSTPANPAAAVNQGLKQIIKDIRGEGSAPEINLVITHGSTVATNALLERKGARTALISTRGFKDVIEIGRQNRPSLYDFSVDPPEPLVPRGLRFEVDERVDRSGKVLVPLNPDGVSTLVSEIRDKPVDSVAVCLLFSFLHPEHERLISAELRKRGYFVSASNEILPEFREFERTSTTVLNAYVSPVLDHYLSSVDESLQSNDFSSNLRVMQSNGGIISLSEAKQAGVRCILSGPAGGVVGASHIAKISRLCLGVKNRQTSNDALKVITFDMGGTSTDVSLIDGTPEITSESMIGGFPLRIPVLDIHTIGAGGGSIARIDLGGALRVGPESAGADPGPACYARRDEIQDAPTVTDANVVLGRLPADHFLGGTMHLDADRAHAVMDQLGSKAAMTAVEAAKGVIEVVNAQMERALRLVSSEKGFDPEDFSLISFGGAGGLHACNLARRVGIPGVIIPPLASTLSAFGMLAADVIRDYSRTIMLSGNIEIDQIRSALNPLIVQGRSDIRDEGFTPENIIVESQLDMRYGGQSYELTIPFTEDFLDDFHRYHELTYGYAMRDSIVEIVNVRLRAIGRISAPEIAKAPLAGENPKAAYLEHRDVHLSERNAQIPLYEGELLEPGNRINGPAIITRKDTTIYLAENDMGIVDQYHNLVATFDN